MSRAAGVLSLCLCMLAHAGCARAARHAATTLPATLPTAEGLAEPQYINVVQATVRPPEGWNPEALKSSPRHTHQVWLSPTGRTAYGVIYFSLPLPVGHDVVLWYFLREMRRSEGEAELLTRQWDPNLRAVRFVAQGGRYTVRTSLLVRGFSGWAVYAGTLSGEPPVGEELDLAERARERTIVGRVVVDRAGK